MISFIDFLLEQYLECEDCDDEQILLEANKQGEKFEKETAENIRKWVKSIGLDKVYTVTRSKQKEIKHSKKMSKKAKENSLSNRDESYSDVKITNTVTGDIAYVECKNSSGANSAQRMLDIDSNFNLVYKNPADEKSYFNQQLKQLILQSKSWKNFKKIFTSRNNKTVQKFFGNRKLSMFDIYSGKCSYKILDMDDDRVKKQEYDELKKGTLTQSEDFYTDKEFKKVAEYYNEHCLDKNTHEISTDLYWVRYTTRDSMLAAMLWKIDNGHTWDIGSTGEIEQYGLMMRDHYLNHKLNRVQYIQIENALFMFDENDNPLNINCPVFPAEKISGTFDLKFTPRKLEKSTVENALYITSRSSMAQKPVSPVSFNAKQFNKKNVELPTIK